MRRLFLVLFALASGAAAFAQKQQDRNDADDEGPDTELHDRTRPALRIPTGPGRYFVGSNLVLANATYQKGYEANYNVGLTPRVGVFLLPNISIGLSASVAIEGHTGYRNITYGLTPFGRIYFAHNNADRPARPLQVFVEAGVGFGGTNNNYESGGATQKVTTNGVRANAMPGVDYFLNEHVAAELGLQYQFTGGSPDAHIIGLNLGFQVFLGR